MRRKRWRRLFPTTCWYGCNIPIGSKTTSTYILYISCMCSTPHTYFAVYVRGSESQPQPNAKPPLYLLHFCSAARMRILSSHQRSSSLDTFLSREIQNLGSCRRLFLDHKKKESFQNEQYHSITIPPYHLTANMSTEVKSAVFAADDPIWIDNVWVDTVVVVGLTCFILCLMGLSKVCVCFCEE